MAEVELHDALLNAAKHGFADEIEEILAKKTKAADVTSKDHIGNTPLHLASAAGHLAAVTALLKHKANANAQNNLGDTPLHKAAFRGHVQVCRALLKEGADPDKKNNEGKRPKDLTTNADVIAYLSPAPEEADDSDEDDKKKKKKGGEDSGSE